MGITVGLHLSKINMKSFTIAAVLCLASSTYGAPQGRRFNIQNVPAQPLTALKTSTAGSQNGLFPLPSSGPIVTNVPNQGPSIDTAFGAFPLGTEHFMTREERNTYLPVMKALEKVMATSNPSPRDLNTLLVLTRDLAAQIPQGESLPSFLGAGFGGFGLNGLESMGLAKTGDVIVQVDNVPYIVTQFGSFLLSEHSLASWKKTHLILQKSISCWNKPETSLLILIQEQGDLEEDLVEDSLDNSSADSVVDLVDSEAPLNHLNQISFQIDDLLLVLLFHLVHLELACQPLAFLPLDLLLKMYQTKDLLSTSTLANSLWIAKIS